MCDKGWYEKYLNVFSLIYWWLLQLSGIDTSIKAFNEIRLSFAYQILNSHERLTYRHKSAKCLYD